MAPAITNVNDHVAPAIANCGSVRHVTWKSMADKVIDARIRAYLREYMEDREVSQLELAERLGMSQSTISKFLSRERGAGLGMALKISRLLRVSMPRLLEEDPSEKFWDEEDLPGRSA